MKELIAKLQQKHAADIERMIRLHRLRETQRIKEQLENKLTHLQGEIEVLNDIEGWPKAQKVNLQNKKIRRLYMSQEEEKRKEMEEFARKLAEEQQERLRKHKAEVRQMRESAKVAEEEKLNWL